MHPPHALFDPKDLRCPSCGYDLKGAALEAARATSRSTNAPPTKPHNVALQCPECGLVTNMVELSVIHNPDRHGAPRSLSPHETIVSGRLFMLVFALIVAAIVIAMNAGRWF